ncbi:MAG: hypothetical protein M0R17_10345 [Candidatus Omnitrophica bacterium]|jgi:hypothetical protein|nr:hypothetical protein [Candidatus Omnitrophota bacterium]
MAKKKDLLQEAIADANLLKETALSNAKKAIEETFVPKMKSAIESRLKQEASTDDDEENLDQVDATDELMNDENPDEKENPENEEDDVNFGDDQEEVNPDYDLNIDDMASDISSDPIPDIPGSEPHDVDSEVEDNDEDIPMDKELDIFITPDDDEVIEIDDEDEEKEMEDEDEEEKDELEESAPVYTYNEEEEPDEDFEIEDDETDSETFEVGQTLVDTDGIKYNVDWVSPTDANSRGALLTSEAGDSEFKSFDELENFKLASEPMTEDEDVSLDFDDDEETIDEDLGITDTVSTALKTELDSAKKKITDLQNQLNSIKLESAKCNAVNEVLLSQSLTKDQKSNISKQFGSAKTIGEIRLAKKIITESIQLTNTRTEKRIGKLLENVKPESKSNREKLIKEQTNEQDDEILDSELFRRFQRLADIKTNK